MPVETKKYKADDLEAFCRDFEQSIDSADNGYVFIMTTENIDFCKASKEVYESDAEKEKLFRQGLEIRIFDEKSEWKWFRTGIDKAYSFRSVTDDEETEKDKVRYRQLDLFSSLDDDNKLDYNREVLKEENNLQNAMLKIKEKYCKNAILKGMDLEDGATTRDRNRQIGGHHE